MLCFALLWMRLWWSVCLSLSGSDLGSGVGWEFKGEVTERAKEEEQSVGGASR